jgi:pantoate--beta-alanine ligase
MKVFETIQAFQEWRRSLPLTQSVGFVPTMGALHPGHESLMIEARKSNEFVVLSIFVNPTQFNQKEDFENYPKTWEEDLQIAKRAGVDAVFAPKNGQSMYPDDFQYRVLESTFSKELCGEFRPGHFDGMLTVVLKLFQITKPTRAYFGEKDHQQLTLVQGMIDAFFLDVKLVACKTLREESGLALSSRNLRLKSEEKIIAPRLYETITKIKNLADAKSALITLGFKVEYLVDKKEVSNTRRYVAAWLGDVRLIDNVSF